MRDLIRPNVRSLIYPLTGRVTGPPVNLVAPSITGVPYIGQVLTVDPGIWSGSPTAYAYQWKLNGVNIGGATASTYTATLADEGVPLTCQVTATNNSGAGSPATSAAAEAWVPLDLGAALRLWLDAKDASTITIATGVSQWADKSGNGNNFTQGTGANQPSYASGKVTFDGTDDRLIGTQILSIEHGLFVAVQNRSTNSDINTSLWSQDGGSNPDFWLTLRNTGQTNTQSLNTNGATNATPTVTGPTSQDMVVANQKASMAGLGITSVNGLQSTNAAAAFNGAQSGTRLVLGTQKLTAGRHFGGDVYETFISNVRHGTPEFQKAEAYLAWRHGTVASLDAGHPWKSTYPTP